ncbi:hypothetical protein KEJ32_07660 [Candidatus Bathyarchaeota archaeon]|nr:hypothetical protein [Candidatus Bathyarchaeota archaeon]
MTCPLWRLFSKEHCASILVLMEVGLMIGRIINFLPTCILLSQGNFSGYFTLMLIPFFWFSEKCALN